MNSFELCARIYVVLDNLFDHKFPQELIEDAGRMAVSLNDHARLALLECEYYHAIERLHLEPSRPDLVCLFASAFDRRICYIYNDEDNISDFLPCAVARAVAFAQINASITDMQVLFSCSGTPWRATEFMEKIFGRYYPVG